MTSSCLILAGFFAIKNFDISCLSQLLTFFGFNFFSESEDGSSVWYYSTPLQVEELLYRLDEEGYEAELVENIRNCKDEIVRQMEVTEQITEQSNSLLHRKTYIEAENGEKRITQINPDSWRGFIWHEF